MTLVITGGSRGIGRAVAIGAARRGHDVALSYASDEAAAEETAAAVRAEGRAAIAVQGDVTDEAHLADLFSAAEKLGPVNAVVVNAGIVGPAAPLADMDVARIRRLVDVNVTGALLTAREAARRMEGGSMVLLSSAAARLGSPNVFVDYAASKGAIDTLTRGLSVELAPKIRVNAVRPGIIDTDIHADCGIPDRAASVGPEQPLGRAGTAEEVADAILWLMSEEAAYVSGALLDVAGGR